MARIVRLHQYGDYRQHKKLADGFKSRRGRQIFSKTLRSTHIRSDGERFGQAGAEEKGRC